MNVKRTTGCLAAVLALAMTLALPEARAEPATPAVSAGCRAAMGEGWDKAFAAYKADDWASALTLTEGAKAACAGDGNLAGLIATFRAEILMRLSRPADAVSELEAVPIASSHPLWVINRLLLLSGLSATGDQTRFLAVREGLIAVNEANLTGGDKPLMVKVERVDSPAGPVDVFRNADKAAPRDTLFILSPKAAVMPISFEVNEGEMDAIGGLLGEPAGMGGDQFGDLNQCGMHATIMVKKKTARSYPDLRKQALDALSGGGEPVSGSQASADAVNFCPGLRAILPGLPRQDD